MSVSNKYIINLLPLFAVIAAGFQYLILHYVYAIDNSIALADSGITAALLSLASWGLAQSIRLYPTRVGITLYSVLSALFFSASSVFISTYLIKWLVASTDTLYLDFLVNSAPIRSVIYWLLFSWAGTFIALNKHAITLEKQFKKQSDSTTLLKEAELFKLRQQLQPHFLYNSLNSISALTMIEPAKAQEMIGLLSDFLRNSVQREAKELIHIKDELDYLSNYLAIESIRFGDRLKVSFNQPKNYDASIPPFLLQPLLENAIKFGLYGNTGEVNIMIDINLDNEILTLTITNPYDNHANKSPKGTGFGLAGVRRRLQLVYARADLLDTQKTEESFTTILKIPQHA